MATKITTLDGYGNPTDHLVTESVADSVVIVNNALVHTPPRKFVAFTREDGKQFALHASSIDDISES